MNTINKNDVFASIAAEEKKRVSRFSVRDLFQENNPNGPLVKVEIRQFIANMKSPYQREKFRLFIENIADGVVITSLPIAVVDENKNSVLWIRFQKAQGRQVFRYPAEEWLVNFVKGYQNGDYRGFNFTVQEFADELLRTEE